MQTIQEFIKETVANHPRVYQEEFSYSSKIPEMDFPEKNSKAYNFSFSKCSAPEDDGDTADA
ncbi:MAG: hypothetical protein FWH04_08210 [Oscillospiraceae bacterium]|nr:hypothetical protein [Oscillospiraceae bacterium]